MAAKKAAKKPAKKAAKKPRQEGRQEAGQEGRRSRQEGREEGLTFHDFRTGPRTAIASGVSSFRETCASERKGPQHAAALRVSAIGAYW